MRTEYKRWTYVDSSVKVFYPTRSTDESIGSPDVEHELGEASRQCTEREGDPGSLTNRSMILTTLDGGTSAAKRLA